MGAAFYLDNSHISTNCSNFTQGNPGIGGTEYLFLTTSYGLQKKDKIEENGYLLLLKKEMPLPADMRYIVVGSKNAAISYCESNKIEQLVIKFENKDYTPNIFNKVSSSVKIIVWAHNVIPRHILNIIAQTKAISLIVNVGREQLDLYRDNKAFLKSTYIYNGIDIKPIKYYIDNSVPFEKRKQEVTYLGSLVYAKGFHILAKAWPEIIKACPNAHLNIIGSGTVYGDKKLGRYGIAEENYENLFMPYLTDTNGAILPSVTFYGRMGTEKEKVLASTKVGVPNPLGHSETFCLSAVEMALWGARIVTRKYVGYLDTVPETAGILFEDEKDLARIVINELNLNRYNNYINSYNYFLLYFSHNHILRKWKECLFCGTMYNQEPIKNKDYNYKYLREYNRILKSSLVGGYCLPTLDTYIRFYNLICKKRIPILY